MQDYDAAGNLAWRVSGLALPSTTNCDTASVPAQRKVSYGHDTRNRLVSTSFGDGSPAISSTGSMFNRNEYANNNPFRFVDPDGRSACTGSHLREGSGCPPGGGLAYGRSGHVYGGDSIGDLGSPESNRQGLSNSRADDVVGQGLKYSVYALVPGVECAANGCGVGGWALAAMSAIPGLRSPTVKVQQPGARTLYLTTDAAVVLNSSGQAVTIWGRAQHTQKTLDLLRKATGQP